MVWNKADPSSAYYYIDPANGAAFADAMNKRTPVPYSAMTGHTENIIDIVFIGIDWSKANPVIMSINPNTMITLCGTEVTKWSAQATDANWRPAKDINHDDPVNGFGIKQANLSKLNERLADMSYTAQANGTSSNAHAPNAYFTLLEERSTNVSKDSTAKISDFYILYYLMGVHNHLAKYGYRMPNVQNPNDPRNWLSVDATSGSTNGFGKLMYLTYDDWVFNFVPRVPNSIAFNQTYLKLDGRTMRMFNTSAVNGVDRTSFNGQMFWNNAMMAGDILYCGQSIISNDFKYKLYLDYYGEGYLYRLPFSEFGNAPYKTAGWYKAEQTKPEEGAILPAYLAMQTDGNLVVYISKKTLGTYTSAMWSSGNAGKWYTKDSKSSLILEAGGVLVQYAAASESADSTKSGVTSDYADLNTITTSDKLDPRCNNYWYTFTNSATGSFGSTMNVSVDANSKCYTNPRVQYSWQDGKIIKTNSKYQMIVWSFGNDLNSIDPWYVVRESNGMFVAISAAKKTNNLLNYCMRGNNWSSDESCKTLANTSSLDANTKSLISYDINNRICKNASTSAMKRFCDYITPNDARFASLVSRFPEFKVINPNIVSKTDNTIYKDGPIIMGTGNVTKFVSKNLNKALTEDDLYLLWSMMVGANGWISDYDTANLLFNKFKSVTNLPIYPDITVTDYNLSTSMYDNRIAPYAIVYNQVGLGYKNFPLYYDVKARADFYAPNKKIPTDSTFWKEIVVNCKGDMPYMYPPSLTQIDMTSSDFINSFNGNGTEFLYKIFFDPATAAYDVIEYSCVNGTTENRFYILKLKSFQQYFNSIKTIFGVEIPITKEICTKNPDWCYDGYLAYINNTDNYNTGIYKMICDDLAFDSDHKAAITKACMDSMGISKCSNPTLRYSAEMIQANGNRDILDYQTWWNDAGCTTDIATLSVGVQSGTDYGTKSKYNNMTISDVKADMADYGTSIQDDKKKMCKGTAAFTSKERFAGGSCVDICNRTDISDEVKNACNLGTVEYCKQGDNVFNPTCIAAGATLTDIETVKTEYCEANPTDARCPQAIKAAQEAAEYQRTMIIIMCVVVVVLIAGGIGYVLYRRKQMAAKQVAAADAMEQEPIMQEPSAQEP